MFGIRMATSAAAAALIAISAGTIPTASHAATISCPAASDPAVTVGYEFTSDPAVVCLAFGDDNPAEKAFEEHSAFPAGAQKIAKTDDAGFVLSDWFSGVSDDGNNDLKSGTDGSFTFLGNSLYDNFVLLFKGGGNELANWSAISIPTTPLLIDWKIIDTGQGSRSLSHVTIYGSEKTTVIPLPAAGILLLSALGGLGIAARRRRKEA